MVVVLFRALNLPPLLGYLLVAWQFGLSWQGALALEALGATGVDDPPAGTARIRSQPGNPAGGW